MTLFVGSARGVRSHRSVTAVPRLLVALVVLAAVAGGSGVAAAETEQGDDPGTPGRSCPGENPNVGLENANPAGVVHSQGGIATAAAAIGCPPP